MRTYVGTGDHGHPRVFITEVPDTPEVRSLASVLARIDATCLMRHGMHAPQSELQQHLHHRLDVAESPTRRLLPHIPIHSPDGFAWGYQGSGPADLAAAILHRELAALPPRAAYLSFRDQVIAELPVAGFQLPATEVWQWIRTNQTLLEPDPAPPPTHLDSSMQAATRAQARSL